MERATGRIVEPAPRAPGPGPRPDTNALLAVVQTAWSPATLWHARTEQVTVFGNLPSYGLGGPTFLAYSSPTGITSLKPGMTLDGGQLRENWLLAGFPGAAGWTHWDSPWAVFLQRRPREVRFETNGVELRFGGAAGHFAMMPLYGAYKPPQKGQEVLKGRGLKEKNLLTWEWPTVVARDPLTRLRYWAGVTRRFPVRCVEEQRIDPGRDAVTLRSRFEWFEVPDEWGTVAITLAPVSPTLGLAITKGQSFPARFSKAPFDFELPTPYGPFFGVPNAAEYEVEFPLLQYVHETEVPAASDATGAPETVARARERLRAVVRERFPDVEEPRANLSEPAAFHAAMVEAAWLARALPHLDAATRSHVTARLGRLLKEEVLVPGRLPERGVPEGGDRGVLAAVWAYVHFAGDHALVRERWDLIRRWYAAPARIGWAGFGPGGSVELGEGPGTALAFARLAYLAGDREVYVSGCAMVAREFVQLHAKQRGAAWFREHQPWDSMEPLDADARLVRLRDGVAGWQIEGPAIPATPEESLLERRWNGFQDLDVARFCRDHLGPDLRQELKRLRERWEPARYFTDDGHGRPSLLRLESLLANASLTNLAVLAAPEKLAGPPSGIVAGALAWLRASGTPRLERLVPRGAAGGFGPMPGIEATNAGPCLVQDVTTGAATGVPAWPRIMWSGWRTPTGEAWTVGEVRAGEGAAPSGPGRVERTDGNARGMAWK